MGPIAIIGAGGKLGSVLLAQCQAEGREVLGTVRPGGSRPARGGALLELDLLQPGLAWEPLRRAAPSVMIHVAAMSQVQLVEQDSLLAHEINVEGTSQLIEMARQLGSRFIFTSTDMVFTGDAAPYGEDDMPHPYTAYGRSKLLAESYVMQYKRALIVRLPLLIGMTSAGQENFFAAVGRELLAAEAGQAAGNLQLFSDEYRTPLAYEDAARALLRLADSEMNGVVHLAGTERLSRADMGRRLAQALGVPPHFTEITRAQVGAELRPADLSLRCERYLQAFGEAPGADTSAVFLTMACALRALYRDD